MDRLEPGTIIITTEDSGSDDWISGAQFNRKWGAKGIVIRVHDSHGLCYQVRHEDNSDAYYEHAEVKRI